MKNKLYIIVLFVCGTVFSQQQDSTLVYKKRVLEATEVDFLSSYYKQDGIHSSVSGGIGSEKLTDFASNITVAMPLNEDDVLTVDVGISAYSSASSSNINPFYATGASGTEGLTTGTPWQASSGASQKDELVSIMANYSHSSDSRNFLWNVDVSFSNEYDYTSIGFGGGITHLFNEKNSEISLKLNAYLDQWRPIYPTELSEYSKYGSGFLFNGYFDGITIFNQNGSPSQAYLPSKFKAWETTARNSYSASVSFSQIITQKMQLSLFFDILKQQGMLSTPYHRIYFADRPNFYVGNPSAISYYTSPSNTTVYQLADDIERLPSSRYKFPIGLRWNYYFNEKFILRAYYRYYIDDWDISSHTFNIEVPVKVSDKFTLAPLYRYYTQKQSKFFAPFETHLSTEQFYTSDYDLSTFYANQYGGMIVYTDIFTATKIFGFGLKNIDLRYNHYSRSDGLSANIGTITFKFVMQ